MKKLLLGVVALGAVALGFAASANADTDQFNADLASIGVTHMTEGGGQMICSGLLRIDAPTMANLVWQQSVNVNGYSSTSLTPAQASQVVAFAVRDLCPGATWRGSGGDDPLQPGCDFSCRVARDHLGAITNNGTFNEFGPG